MIPNFIKRRAAHRLLPNVAPPIFGDWRYWYNHRSIPVFENTTLGRRYRRNNHEPDRTRDLIEELENLE